MVLVSFLDDGSNTFITSYKVFDNEHEFKVNKNYSIETKFSFGARK